MTRPGLGTEYDPLAGILSPPQVASSAKSPPVVEEAPEQANDEAPAEATPLRRHPAIVPPPLVRQSRHKLTTYLPVGVYEWVAGEVQSAQAEGYAASIADVVRMALEKLRADYPEEVGRRLRGQ